jgi:hypothetical protein
VRFGPGARIGGRLDYTAPEPVAIPASVIDPDAHRLHPLGPMGGHGRGIARDWRMRDIPALPGASAVFGFLVVTIAFFVVLAAVALSLAPERVEAMRRAALARPGLALLGGVLGLATVFGLVPISVMTLVGLPLLPLVLLVILVVWILGYAFGVYVVALRVWTGMGGAEPTMPVRLAVYAGGLLVVALLNVIPFVGWVVNFTLVLYGIGALGAGLRRRLRTRNGGPARRDLEHVARKWEPVSRSPDVRYQKVRAGRVNANERDTLVLGHLGERLGPQDRDVLRRGQQDQAGAAQFGEGAADGLGSDAEEIGDVGPAHRQVDMHAVGRLQARARHQHDEEGRHPLARGLPAERHQVVLHRADLPERGRREEGRILARRSPRSGRRIATPPAPPA